MLIEEPVSPLLSVAAKPQKLWIPKRVLFTPEAMEESFGQQIFDRVSHLGLPVEVLKNNRLTNLRGEDEKETYRLSKTTMAVVTAPPSAMKLQPIPPSADWQFHLAQGCPAHCHYCYLAGSLAGPPVVRVFANLPSILENTKNYIDPLKPTSFEASCYTDPLGIEHLTGSLAECIRFFGKQENGRLRFTTKFANADSLLQVPHNGNTRWRFSLNAETVAKRLEGGTASLSQRIEAMRKAALPRADGGGGYPIGAVIAPIMPIENWEAEYTGLLDKLEANVGFAKDLSFELISHRFTPGSKEVLSGWYPNTSLDMNEATRAVKRNKFGGFKYVYTKDVMAELRHFFESEISRRFPNAKILYWT
ncbi:MAG: radical SAM protein [Williamsia sp.]|nr:radical SAM protein [Williamsia sp.]